MFIDCQVDLLFLWSVSTRLLTVESLMKYSLFGAYSVVYVVISCPSDFNFTKHSASPTVENGISHLTFEAKTKSYARLVFTNNNRKEFIINTNSVKQIAYSIGIKMAYEEKKKLLFDCLQTAEKTIIGTSLEQKETHTGHSPQRNESKVVGRRFQGRESIFKRPAAPISKCLKPRRAPDYQVRSSLIYSKFLPKFYSIDLVPGESTQMEKVFIVRRRHIRSDKHISCICISQGN